MKTYMARSDEVERHEAVVRVGVEEAGLTAIRLPVRGLGTTVRLGGEDRGCWNVWPEPVGPVPVWPAPLDGASEDFTPYLALRDHPRRGPRPGARSERDIVSGG